MHGSRRAVSLGMIGVQSSTGSGGQAQTPSRSIVQAMRWSLHRILKHSSAIVYNVVKAAGTSLYLDLAFDSYTLLCKWDARWCHAIALVVLAARSILLYTACTEPASKGVWCLQLFGPRWRIHTKVCNCSSFVHLVYQSILWSMDFMRRALHATGDAGSS